MGKQMRKIAGTVKTTGVEIEWGAKTGRVKLAKLIGAVGLAGLAGLTGLVGSDALVAYADGPITEVMKTNFADGFHITQINEGANTLRASWDMNITDWAHPDYRLTDYHIFWGEIDDAELPEMLERTDGVVTVAKGQTERRGLHIHMNRSCLRFLQG